ncbi:reverse transcriptase domain-containing protein [Tanacetum coccineum]
MHIEKNVFESLLGTLLMNDKSKDTNKARQDLEQLNIRPELWLSKKGNRKFIKPHATYSFPPEKRRKFCEFIKGVKLPDGFGSNFKPKVTNNDNNIIGMKSHDCHLMMQWLLPAGAQAYLDSKNAVLLCSRMIYQQNFLRDFATSLELFALASEPKDHATYYTSCIVNGVKFVVHSRDERLITQNSGVSMPGENGSMYYGLLEEIVELNYLTHQKVVLFRCKWLKTNNTHNTSLYVTKNNKTSISTKDDLWKENQYILATQARQVFYLEDPSRSHHWKVVQEVNHQNIWDKDVIVDADVVHDSNSSDVALTANLDDLEYTRLSRPGPSTEVSFIPTSCVNDDDFIHDDVEYDVVHVLSSDSKDEDSD